MRKKKVTPELIKKAYSYALLGFNNKQICEAVDISEDTFYKYEELTESLKGARNKLRADVAKAILENMNDDAATRIFAAKRLNVLNGRIDVKRPTNAQEALEGLAIVTEGVANGELNFDQSKQLESLYTSWIKLYEITELEERINQLEKRF